MKTLLMVDIQNDFLPTGALPVPEGDQIIPLVNQLQKKFELIVATQDWHPKNHESFAVFHGREPGEIITLHGIEQVLWPVHCVQKSFGAQLAVGLETNSIERVFQKGINPEVDSYSGFFDNEHQNDTGLASYLVEKGVSELFIVGLALDYCVKFTALDARQCGLNTSLIVDGTRGVNIDASDSVKAVKEMSEAGVNIVQSLDLLTV
ncbi:MAG: bifunctional nicotinamidase/pyrazinamidase [Deltaproteobacteria bacterium]|jgi:nicotinamidase/pyrazinamidase|nr:bifunctional nicotinamidase/pyrazinamidase [Deltaproteobacteria bacterium]MBT4090540.1 bifunctional nicotinamidase/pyrazinamidase [Deltaproteobacteria bacterium]MBT4268171.1 bifunctional nicotinamidase/pyrazinamidase [Deltaproteobacteria bacterium]MBT4640200.1 bifunctional nicotinamidase/pyrazinamidase [Deltaproteobacteria bacterium]MBT6500849.1 bifunctional nicotinamidase/pyrazinamidase [Deltaproteobacteria bacterium]